MSDYSFFGFMRAVWKVKLDSSALPLLFIFCLLFGVCFGGLALDIFDPEMGFNSLLCFFTGFLFGQFASVLSVKVISM